MLEHLFFSFTTLSYAAPPAGDAELQAKVQTLFEDCVMCHDSPGDPSDPGGLDLESPISSLIGQKSAAVSRLMVDPGNPGQSELLRKLVGASDLEGELMPIGGDPYSPEQIALVRDWIASLPADSGAGLGAAGGADGDADDDARTQPRGHKPFHGTHQIALPTTTTLGRNTLQYSIDHRFGRIGTPRGAFGLDSGASMSAGLAYGILDGWDVQLRRSSTRKNWELGTKYVPLRQEDGKAVSLGGYASVEYFRDFDVANPWVGNVQAMLSRLWFDRWSTMLTLGYHMRTNRSPRVIVDVGNGPEPVEDKRDTVTAGLASTVWLGKKKRWGVDMEYFIPIPDGGAPNKLYYRGGDADPDGSSIGSWSLGGSYYTGKHFFQVFFTNNRLINTNMASTGGQSSNPFDDPSASPDNPLNELNFFLGFNLARQFTLGKRAKKRKAKKAAAQQGGEQ